MSAEKIEVVYNAEQPLLAIDFGTCAHDAWDLDGMCTTCNQVCNQAEGTCTYDANTCTICHTAKCISCFVNAPGSCTQCKPGSSLDDSNNCVCDVSDGLFDDENGNCRSCDIKCAECFGRTNTRCTACSGTFNLQPNSYVCELKCPLGYIGSNNVCTGSPSEINYVFDKLLK